jgi:ribose transport system ATP-binding protein
METTLLAMAGIRKSFDATIALDAVDLTISAGTVHAIIGENGAGKSTLMKLLSGALTPDAGKMIYNGRPYAPRSPSEARTAGVGMMYQELALCPHMTVEENMMLGAETMRYGLVRRRECGALARSALEQLSHAEIDIHARAGDLPIGIQQIVEIGRAIASGCQLLILDEPTSSLARQDIDRLFEVIGRLKTHGHAVVYISHFLEEVKRVADVCTVLRDGKVVGTVGLHKTSIDTLVDMMVGRPLDRLYHRSGRTRGRALLTVAHLAGKELPTEASFTLHAGEVFGIAGLLGAGKTELLRALFGLDPVQRGEITLGVWHGPASPTARWKQGAGMVSEDRAHEGLALSLSVAENLTLTALQKTRRWKFLSPSRQSQSAREWMQRLDVHARTPQQQVGTLSGGNQQKIALARLLYHDADILLLDEPTRGIDVGSKSHIYELINRIAAGETDRAPKGVLVISSHIPELLGICDRIAVMHRGVLGPARPAQEYTEQMLTRETIGGEH